LPEEYKELITVPIFKKGNVTDCSNCRGISLFPTTYKILSYILLSRLTPHAEEIIGDHQFGFDAIGQQLIIYSAFIKFLLLFFLLLVFSHQLFTNFKQAYDSVRREVLYNNLTEFGFHMKLVRLLKMCLNVTYSAVWVRKHLSDIFPIRNGLKPDVLSPLLFNFALEYAIRRIQVNQDGLQLNGKHQSLVYADDVNILDESVHTIKKIKDGLLVGSKEIGLEVNADKTKYMVISQDQNAGRSHNLKE